MEKRNIVDHQIRGHRMTFKNKLFIYSAAAALLLSYGGTAIAQEAPPAPIVTETGDEIIVTGVRSSIENSLDAKKIADSISDTLSADQADRFPDNNIGEALARIPGVSFQRDNDSGDGQFISIRGLDSAFVTTTHNGLRTGTSDTFRRTAYDNITGDNISSITVTKAPLPEHASEGIGGVVDIRTRGALERSERVRASASLIDNSFADKTGYRLGGGFTKHLSDNVGVNFSGTFRRRYINNFQINPATTTPDLISFPTLNDVNGNPVTFDDDDQLLLVPTDFLDIGLLNTEQVNYTHDEIQRDNISLSGTIDMQVTPSTKFTIGGRHNETDTTQQSNTIEFDVDNEFDDVTGINLWDDPEINFRSGIEDEEEVESRLFFRSETNLDNWDINFVGGWSRAYRNLPFVEINFFQELEDTPSSPGTSTADEASITFAPFDLSVGDGLFPAPVPLNSTVFLEALDPFCQEGGSSCGEIVDYNHELEDSRENERWSGKLDVVRDFSGHSFIDNVKAGVLWERSTFSDRDIDVTTSDDSLGQDGIFAGTDAGPNTVGDSNIEVGELGLISNDIISFDPIGNPFASSGFLGIPRFNEQPLRLLNDNFRRDFLASGQDPLSTEIIDAEENFYAAYVQSKWTFDKLNIVGGVRIEQYDAEFTGSSLFSSSIIFEDALGNGDALSLSPPQLDSNTASTDNFEVLPRIAFNYDVSDKTKLRASYTTALARPTFDLLAPSIDGDFDVELNPLTPLTGATIADVDEVEASFEIGNPELRNAYSHNFDISAEYYINKQNAISAAVFYKTIDDFIFSSFATDDAVNFSSDFDAAEVFAAVPFTAEGIAAIEQLGGFEALLATPNSTVSISQAQNGEKAEIYGLELGLFHTFDYLPGILSNLGFIGNMTFTDSKTDINLGTLGSDDALVLLGLAQEGDDVIQEFPFFNSPDFIANAAIFFDYEGLEATLSYRNSGLQLEEIEAFGISQFQQDRTFIDLDIEYTFKDVGPLDRVTVFFEANDLTDSGQKPSVFETRGETRAFNDNSTFNGRTFTFGTRLRF